MIGPTSTNLPTAASPVQNTGPANTLSASSLTSTFSQILSSSMMSGGSGSGDSSSGGMTGMLMPLMMMLLEQIMAQQTSGQSSTQPSAQTVGAPAAAAGMAPTASATGTNEQPIGRPVGGVITQGFHPGHNGIDFGVPVGTNVKSTMAGKIVYAGWNNEGYGNLVIVQNGPYRTYYGHLSSIPVKIGDSVAAGQVIGLSGNTGHSTGPHLHYEVRVDGSPIDPTARTLNSGKSW